jgi:iron complex outermembrane recepter protein
VTLLPDNSTGTFTDQQKEDNVSWRAGLNFKPQPGTLLYASVSKGYKAGGFPTLSASSYTQFKPVAQEELLAYEVGFKAPLTEHTVRLNGAAFYYDYSNKQFLGRNADPFFGELSVLVNVPKSSVKGGELQLQWLPVRGLNVAAAVTYLDTRIGRDSNGMGFVNYNEFGGLENFSGNRFPYTPMWQGNVGIDYDWTLTSSVGAFAGVGLTSRSATKGGLEDDPRLAINAYTLTDLRAGIKSSDNRWRVAAYGRNITSKYYWNNVMHVQDTIIRYAGMPAQYGVTVAYRW